MTDTLQSRELRSLVTDDARLELFIETVAVPEPKDDEVVVRIDAAPINPTDLALLFGPADLATLRTEGGKTTADIPEKLMKVVKARIGRPMPVGVEGAGEVMKAGTAAGELLGKIVSLVGDGMYAQYRCVKAKDVMPMPQGVSARQAASSFVNPMTALAMVETMRDEGHSAIVHTVAASNLGQILNRICLNEGIGLVNIVRRPEQEKLLRDAGAKYVVNSASDNFRAELTDAIAATGATLAFDAIGGGRMANTVLSCMERASSRGANFNRYGSETFKQLYVYGRLDLSPQELTAAYGFAWSVGGWLLSHFLAKATPERIRAMKQKVAEEITTTFASHYSAEVSLEEALSPQAIGIYSKRATGSKYLVLPNG